MSDREPAIITDCRRYASDSTIGENARKANQQYVDAYDELRQQLAARDQEIAQLKKALSQVDDVLVVNWITCTDGDYRKALQDLIAFNIQIHDDPAVSEIAAQRQQEIEQLKRQLKSNTGT